VSPFAMASRAMVTAVLPTSPSSTSGQWTVDRNPFARARRGLRTIYTGPVVPRPDAVPRSGEPPSPEEGLHELFRAKSAAGGPVPEVRLPRASTEVEGARRQNPVAGRR
jgi:hypothetical protein